MSGFVCQWKRHTKSSSPFAYLLSLLFVYFILKIAHDSTHAWVRLTPIQFSDPDLCSLHTFPHPELPASLTEDDAVHWETEHTTIACASRESSVRSRSVNLVNGSRSIISVVLTNLKKSKSKSKSPLTRYCQWLRSCFPFCGLWPGAAPTKLQACSLESPSAVV
jgi:hypothetical protein